MAEAWPADFDTNVTASSFDRSMRSSGNLESLAAC